MIIANDNWLSRKWKETWNWSDEYFFFMMKMLSKEHPDTAATTGYTSADDNMSGGAMELSALDTLFDQGRVRVMGDIPDVKLIANNMIQNYVILFNL